MNSIDDIKDTLGTRGALAYLHDYHTTRIHNEMTWDDAVNTLWDYSIEESEVVEHARFMNECGSDFMKYLDR